VGHEGRRHLPGRNRDCEGNIEQQLVPGTANPEIPKSQSGFVQAFIFGVWDLQ
jgi:hypothetical protein